MKINMKMYNEMHYDILQENSDQSKTCNNCCNKNQCINQQKTQEGNSCLYFNVISYDINKWCKGV